MSPEGRAGQGPSYHTNPHFTLLLTSHTSKSLHLISFQCHLPPEPSGALLFLWGDKW